MKEGGIFRRHFYILGLVLKNRRIYLPVLLAYILLAYVSPLVLLVFPRYIIDDLANRAPIDAVLRKTALMAFLYLAAYLCSHALGAVKANLETGLKARLNVALCEKCMRLEYADLEDGEVVNSINSARMAVSGGLTNTQALGLSGEQGIGGYFTQLADIVSNILKGVTYLYILGRLQAWMIAVILLGLALVCVCSRARKRADMELRNYTAPFLRKDQYCKRVLRSFEAGKDIRLYNLEEWLINKFSECNDRYIQAKNEYRNKFVLASIVSILCNVAVVFCAYASLIFLLADGLVTVGEFTMIAGAVVSLFGCATALITAFMNLDILGIYMSDFRKIMLRKEDMSREECMSRGEGVSREEEMSCGEGVVRKEAMSCGEDVACEECVAREEDMSCGEGVACEERMSCGEGVARGERMSRKVEAGILKRGHGIRGCGGQQEGSRHLEKGNHEIVFDKVSFTYKNAGQEALKEISVTIKSGDTISVVGANGAGKSTFVKLLTGLYRPTRGKIYIDGHPMQEYRREDIVDNMGVLFQDFKVYAMTAQENVAMSEGCQRELFERSIEASGIRERIEKLPERERTPLLGFFKGKEEAFSGGEEQKLALARALYKDTKILILDEPAAALDALAESGLYERMLGQIQDRTVLFVSHRMACARFCRRILVFDQGSIVESGAHDELIGRGGLYAKMWNAQVRYYHQEAKG